MKIARSWRIRRSALEDFLERGERSETLIGRLRPFLEVPDNVLAIAQNRELAINLDTAFFRIGAAHGGLLIKFMGSQSETEDELRDSFERDGFEVGRLEEEGRFRFFAETDSARRRTAELWGLLEEGIDDGRSVWVNFNWEEYIALDEALSQQEEITEFVEDSSFVVQTTMLEEILDEWPGMDLRRAQALHSGTIWLSESGLALSRVTPPPSGPSSPSA